MVTRAPREMRDVPVRRPAAGTVRQAPASQVDPKQPGFAHDFSRIPVYAPEVGLALNSPAQPLSPEHQQRVGARLGADLTDVRVHRGHDAAIAAAILGADAFTVGRDVVLGAGQAGSQERLLVHELVHVAQQARATGVPSRLVSEPGDPAEREAETVAANPRPVMEAPSSLIHRQGKPPIPGWNFTPADFTTLQRAGGSLTIAPDSTFFPAKLQENLLRTLAFVLGPTIRPPATEGVNALDLFHGHLVVRKDPATAAQAMAAVAKAARFKKGLARERTRALGSPVRYPKYPLTPGNIGAYQKAIGKVLPSFGSLLDETSKLPGAALMYHTFEFNQPRDRRVLQLDPEDPRRHYVTPLDTNKPRQYTPPSGGYEKEYTLITTFVFLVDPMGAVHVRPTDPGTTLFTTLELSTITGTTFPEPLEPETLPVGDFPVPGVERPAQTAFPA